MLAQLGMDIVFVREETADTYILRRAKEEMERGAPICIVVSSDAYVQQFSRDIDEKSGESRWRGFMHACFPLPLSTSSSHSLHPLPLSTLFTPLLLPLSSAGRGTVAHSSTELMREIAKARAESRAALKESNVRMDGIRIAQGAPLDGSVADQLNAVSDGDGMATATAVGQASGMSGRCWARKRGNGAEKGRKPRSRKIKSEDRSVHGLGCDP